MATSSAAASVSSILLRLGRASAASIVKTTTPAAGRCWRQRVASRRTNGVLLSSSNNRQLSSAAAAVSEAPAYYDDADDDDTAAAAAAAADDEEPPVVASSKKQQHHHLVRIRDTVVAYPSDGQPPQHHHHSNYDSNADGKKAGRNSVSVLNISTKNEFVIKTPDQGGHCLLGKNGAGKTLIKHLLQATSTTDEDDISSNQYTIQTVEDGGNTDTNTTNNNNDAITTAAGWNRYSVSQVSFASHEALLAEQGGTITAYKAITGGYGNLTKAAQFLIIRFGLYQLLHRAVNTLSTGEIRKVMLVAALAQRPRLLILDNAFDGLDVATRDILKELVGKTIRGFTADILVQAVNAKNTAHTQVLLMTHRAEEIVDEIQTVSYWEEQEDESGSSSELVTVDREGVTGSALLQRALFGSEADDHADVEPWQDPTLPTVDDIRRVWEVEDTSSSASAQDQSSPPPPLVQTSGVSVRRGEAVLLEDLNWTIEPSQRWLVAGGNGAGKSTLSRLLVEGGDVEGSWSQDTGHVGWVSTELHMRASQSQQIAADTIKEKCNNDAALAQTVAEWLQLDQDVLSQPFNRLSQGQQKLVLIAAALASRPKMLVADEPLQGLDLIARRRVLGLIERVLEATGLSLIYITHHLEELVPSVTHVIHLEKGNAVFQGRREDYDPTAHA